MSKKLLGFIFTLIFLHSCMPEDQTDKFWDSIRITNKNQPFIFVFSNTKIPACAKYGQPQLEKVLNGKVNDIIPEHVNGFMMYPSPSDPQYSSIAEELKFIFDENGNNTFNTWPAYVNDLSCFNIDSTLWNGSIKNSQSKSPQIKLGINSTPSDQEIKVYVKGLYTESISDHSIAVYAYKKSELTSQTTSKGIEKFTLKNKIIYSLTPTTGKYLASNSSGREFRKLFSLDTSSIKDLSNIGIVAVVYSLYNNVPNAVINSIKLESI